MGTETWLLLVSVVVLAWLYSRWRHSYWSSKGVPSIPTMPFIGHYHKEYFISSKAKDFYEQNYTKFYKSMMCGLYDFFTPVLVVWDLELMKHIFVKDFDHFTDIREFALKTAHERDKVMTEMLPLKSGEEWKSLRSILTPTFSSGKMKSMFPLLCDKAEVLTKVSMKESAEKHHVDMKKKYGRFTLDAIGSCAFGIETNCLINDNDEFISNVEALMTISASKTVFFMFMPRLFNLLGLSINPPEADFFAEITEQTIAARRAGQKRGDFLDLLLEAADNTDNGKGLDEATVLSQATLFLVAGYQTTASVLTFASFLLAKNKDQQDRLRNELRQLVKEHGDITYQAIMEAKFLDACLQESLRLYSPAVVTERSCTKAYKLPGTEVTFKPGDLVQVPIWSIHHDARYWPHPEAFSPDRFLPENKDNIQPYSFLPFGMGPRNCIAMRFAQLEVKIVLAKLLLKAELELAPGYQEMTFKTVSGVVTPDDGVNLVLKPTC